MKDYIEIHFPERMLYDVLRAAVREAWDLVGEEFFFEKVNKMKDRLEAVIRKEGGHTEY